MRIEFSESHKRLGYVHIKIEGLWIKRSRYLMERKLGRKLLKIEVVHHGNKIRDDDRLENLFVMFKWCHNRLHHKENKFSVGRKQTEDAKRRIGEAQKGNTNRKGCTLSEETKKKLSEARKRYWMGKGVGE